MSHVTHVNESNLIYEWVVSDVWMNEWMNEWMNDSFTCVIWHIWISGGTLMDELCRTYEGVMSNVWMSHDTHMNESCHTYECVVANEWMSHISHMKESCRTYEWVMAHVWTSRVSRMIESCHTCEWSHTWMSQVSHMNESCHTSEWVMAHLWMSHVTHTNESCRTYEWVMSRKGMSHVTQMMPNTESQHEKALLSHYCHHWLIQEGLHVSIYEAATISRPLTIVGLFCKRALWKRLYSEKQTYNFKEPTNYGHLISSHTIIKIIGLFCRI